MDFAGEAVPRVMVMMNYVLEPDGREDVFFDETDAAGDFALEFRWNKYAEYSVVLVYGNQSERPNGFQSTRVERESRVDDAALQFTLDVIEPEKRCEWIGTVQQVEAAAREWANGAPVMVNLIAVGDNRVYWAVTAHGGRFSFEYDWNKTALYGFDVYNAGARATITSYVLTEDDEQKEGSNTAEDVPAASHLIEDFSGGPMEIKRGDHRNNIEIDPPAADTDPGTLVSGMVKLAGSGVARDALVLLKYEAGAAAVPPVYTQIAWAVTDESGAFEIKYDPPDGVMHFAVEVVYANHRYVPEFEAGTATVSVPLNLVIDVALE